MTDWWVESGMPEGVEDLLVDGLDSKSMKLLVQEFYTQHGYNFSEFKKYLLCKGIRIIAVQQVDIFFSEKE